MTTLLEQEENRLVLNDLFDEEVCIHTPSTGSSTVRILKCGVKIEDRISLNDDVLPRVLFEPLLPVEGIKLEFSS